MKLRSAYSSKTLCAALASAFILFFQSAAWAQSLTASANPPSGGAGLTDSYLTGSGFAAGALTGATVHFGASCAAPAVASGPVILVATQGVLRRFEFLIPASLTPGTYKVWVSGTAGATAFNTLNTPSCSTIAVTSNISGTASLGAAISGGLVTVVDANGIVNTGTTASDGTFTVNSAGLTPPFLVKVVTTTPSSSFPAGTALYSVSADASVSTHINVDVLTDLMVHSYYSALGIDADTAFANPQAAGNAAPSPLAVQELASTLIPAVQLWLNKAGITATAGSPSNGAINLISSPFIAFPPGVPPTSGLDAVLDDITAEAVNPTTGLVSGLTIAGGTITETISATYGGDAFTFNTMTTDSATGNASTASFMGLALNSTTQPVVDGINAGLTTFKNIVNSKGSALTGSDLLPFYAPDYVNDGDNAAEDANNFAQQVAGITILSLQVFEIKSLNTTTNVADVIAAYNVTQGGQTQSGTQEWIFKEEMGTWLLYGDQQVAQISAGSESRTSEGPGLSFETDIFAEVQAATSIGVTSATVSGGGTIWNGATSGALTHSAQLIQNGQTFDIFYRISQNLGFNLALLPKPGTPFTFNLTTASSGSPTYTVTNNAFTTEKIVIFANVTAGNGPLSSVVGQTLTYGWTLPTTYAIGQVNLYAHFLDGPGNNPATHDCEIDSTSQLGPTSTSGSITIPANMSACGLSSGDAIKAVQVFVGVQGVNGEDNIVGLYYPY